MKTLNSLGVLCFSVTTLFAGSLYAQTHEQTSAADLRKFQQVCKGKTMGAEVSFAHKGVIWNGTCESTFMPTDKSTPMAGNEANIYSVCASDKDATTMTVNGNEVKGKCVLMYTPPMPK